MSRSIARLGRFALRSFARTEGKGNNGRNERKGDPSAVPFGGTRSAAGNRIKKIDDKINQDRKYFPAAADDRRVWNGKSINQSIHGKVESRVSECEGREEEEEEEEVEKKRLEQT